MKNFIATFKDGRRETVKNIIDVFETDKEIMVYDGNIYYPFLKSELKKWKFK